MNLSVTGAPHIRGKERTERIMLDVVIALVPAVVAGTYFFGLRALLLTLVSVAAALAAEWLMNLVLHRPNTLKDGSALVTGVLLALTLPASVPYWLVAVGSAFAVVFVKGLCGGLGQNLFNPALAARAFMLLLWPSWLVRYAAPGTTLPIFGNTVDIVTSATPLHHMQMPSLPEISIPELLLGSVGGTIGEVSALALLLGAAYLLVRKVISIRIPAAYLGTIALLTLVFHKTDSGVVWMIYSLLSGGVLLGAFFMATDYTTSPVTPKGQILYGIGCGALTVFFRYEGLFPEGFTYAILLMNACVWLLDRYTAPKRFGTTKGGGV